MLASPRRFSPWCSSTRQRRSSLMRLKLFNLRCWLKQGLPERDPGTMKWLKWTGKANCLRPTSVRRCSRARMVLYRRRKPWYSSFRTRKLASLKPRTRLRPATAVAPVIHQNTKIEKKIIVVVMQVLKRKHCKTRSTNASNANDQRMLPIRPVMLRLAHQLRMLAHQPRMSLPQRARHPALPQSRLLKTLALPL